MSVAAAKGREGALRREIRAALAAGETPDRLDEALLQLVLFAGYARSINAFRVLQDLAPHRPSGDRVRDVRRRGQALCRRIYGPLYGRMIARMRSYHPALAEGILVESYGRILSRGGLSTRERELIAVSVLAAFDVPLQLRSHVEGARRVGARPSEIRAVLRLANGS